MYWGGGGVKEGGENQRSLRNIHPGLLANSNKTEIYKPNRI